MVGRQVGAGFDRERKVAFESVDDTAVEPLPFAPRQRGISRVTHQHVLECVRYIRKFTTLEDHPGSYELRESGLQRIGRFRGDSR